MRVSELMTKQVVCCKTTDNLGTAAKLMWDADCGSVPVVAADGVVKGMITDRDICMACFMRNATPAAILVQDAMSKTLHSCSPETSIADAEKTMRKAQVRRMPVVDRQRHLVGVLSLADIAREAGRELDHGSKQIEPGEVLQVLEAICQPQQQGQARPA